MKNLKLLLALSVISMLLSGCNIYIDSGKVRKSSTAGYKQYTNKTINVSVLTPEGWSTEVTIGGEYVMKSPDSKRPRARRPAIYVSSSSLEFLSLPSSTTLEAYKKNRLSFITEENIGPKLRVSTKKSILAGHDAYEISYSYKVKELPQKLMVQETFTLVNGKIYRLTYYADEDVYSKFLKELQVVKRSYRILGK